VEWVAVKGLVTMIPCLWLKAQRCCPVTILNFRGMDKAAVKTGTVFAPHPHETRDFLPLYNEFI